MAFSLLSCQSSSVAMAEKVTEEIRSCQASSTSCCSMVVLQNSTAADCNIGSTYQLARMARMVGSTKPSISFSQWVESISLALAVKIVLKVVMDILSCKGVKTYYFAFNQK